MMCRDGGTKVADASQFINIADLRRAAERRLPRSVFDYIDGGADGEVTLRENTRAFDDVTFRPRCAVEVPSCDLRTSVLGTPIEVPFIFAPVGSSRIFWPRGEEVAAGVAGRTGTIYSLSTLSGCRLEDVKKSTPGPAWYQLYLCGGREVASATVQRAREAGYSALILTIDTAVSGLRERDFRNGAKAILSRKFVPMLPHAWQFVSRPGWLADFYRDGGLMKFPNVMLPDGPMLYADVATALEQSTVTWSDRRIRGSGRGRSSSGACTSERRAARRERGAAAIVVRTTAAASSMACARRFDRCPRSSGRLTAVSRCCSTAASAAAATSSRRLPGARRGSARLRHGSPPPATRGQRAVDILRADCIRTMKLLGVTSLAELNRRTSTHLRTVRVTMR
jgi:L-lactate dehydrogenase (cytochrome)